MWRRIISSDEFWFNDDLRFYKLRFIYHAWYVYAGTEGELKVWLLPIRHPPLQEGGWLRRASAVLPPGNTRYPLYRRQANIRGRSGRYGKYRAVPEFDHRTIQPLTIRYTDYAIPAVIFKGISGKTRKSQSLACSVF